MQSTPRAEAPSVGITALDGELRQALRSLCRYSDGRGLVHLAGHLLLALASGVLVQTAGDGPWLLPAMLLHGIVLVFLFAPLHECLHRTAFASRGLNDAVGLLCGAVVLLVPAWFRAFHLAHHRHTQDPDRDPELAEPPATRGSGLWLRLSGLPYWRDALTVLIRLALGRERTPWLAAAEARRARRQALAYLVLFALAFLFAPEPMLRYWLIPVLLGQPALRLYLLAEHHGRPFVADMRVNSRSLRSAPPLRFLAWNMPFHGEHHLHPAIPFHALPAAHRLLAPQLACVEPGYGAFVRKLLRGEFTSAASAPSAAPRQS